MSFRNVRQWRAALDQQGRNVQAVLREATPAVARYTRDTIRKRVPPGNTSTSGMSNRFPGYAATGDLKNAIVAGPVRTRVRAFHAKVGIADHANAFTRTKARVHEYGKVIHARRAPYLHFQVRGQWVKVKRVRVRAKRFFRAGWDEAQRNFPEILGRHVRQRWPSRR